MTLYADDLAFYHKVLPVRTEQISVDCCDVLRHCGNPPGHRGHELLRALDSSTLMDGWRPDGPDQTRTDPAGSGLQGGTLNGKDAMHRITDGSETRTARFDGVMETFLPDRLLGLDSLMDVCFPPLSFRWK